LKKYAEVAQPHCKARAEGPKIFLAEEFGSVEKMEAPEVVTAPLQDLKVMAALVAAIL
jgi:hypothetical protein